MVRPVRGQNPYHRFSGHIAENIATAQALLERRGYRTYVFNQPDNIRIAEASLGVRQIGLNAASPYWENPRLRAREYRRTGHLSTTSPMGVIHHEIAHTKDKAGLERFKAGGDKAVGDWKAIVPGRLGAARRMRESWRSRDTARRVSGYASTSPAEMVAEVYAGRRSGQRYDHQVMRVYSRAAGRKTPGLRSQLHR